MNTATVTIVTDNTAAFSGLEEEHGLSFYAAAAGVRVLFDTGQGAALPVNAARLGVDLSTLDAVALSHGHYDHSGGLARVLSQAQPAVCLHPAALAPCYRRLDSPPHKFIGMSAESAALLSGTDLPVVHCTGPTHVAGPFWLTGPIPRRHAAEPAETPFFSDPACLVPNEIPDDQAMWFETAVGVVVLLGCAHAGVANTLDYVAELSGAPRIHAVIGGMHLNSAPPERVDAALDALRRHDVRLAAPLHCTGPDAARRLRDTLPNAHAEAGAGSRFSWPL